MGAGITLNEYRKTCVNFRRKVEKRVAVQLAGTLSGKEAWRLPQKLSSWAFAGGCQDFKKPGLLSQPNPLATAGTEISSSLLTSKPFACLWGEKKSKLLQLWKVQSLICHHTMRKNMEYGWLFKICVHSLHASLWAAVNCLAKSVSGAQAVLELGVNSECRDQQNGHSIPSHF